MILVGGATILLLSQFSPHFQSCQLISNLSDAPHGALGVLETGTTVPSGSSVVQPVRLPIRLCQPIPIWSFIPFASVAVLLLLPDYAEVGVGGVAFKRLLNDFREVTEDLKSTVEKASGISKDLEAGTVMKGNIRNVELRVETVQELLMGAMTSSAASTQGQLYDAGWPNNCYNQMA